MEKIPKIKIISLGETALSTIEKEIITHENISIITIKNDYKDLKINFQDTDVILKMAILTYLIQKQTLS